MTSAPTGSRIISVLVGDADQHADGQGRALAAARSHAWTGSTRCPHRPDQPEHIRPNERTARIRGRRPRRHPAVSGDRPWLHIGSTVSTPNPNTLRLPYRTQERLRLAQIRERNIFKKSVMFFSLRL